MTIPMIREIPKVKVGNKAFYIDLSLKEIRISYFDANGDNGLDFIKLTNNEFKILDYWINHIGTKRDLKAVVLDILKDNDYKI